MRLAFFVPVLLLFEGLGLGSRPKTSTALELTYLRKDDVSYFIHASTREAVFIQHDGDDFVLDDIDAVTFHADIQQKIVSLVHKGTGERVLFTTDEGLASTDGYDVVHLVRGIGQMVYDDNAVRADGTLALGCGCFTEEALPTVNGQPVTIKGTLIGTESCSRYTAGQFGLAEGSSWSCAVTCGSGYGAICLEGATFDR